MICPNTLSLELAQAAADWPSAAVLVFHERERRRPEEPYLREIEKASHGRALLSLEPVAYDELDRLAASAHVGIILYQEELGPNFALMAGASGKMGQYLRCGLPVVALALRGLEDVVRNYRCGVCVSSPSEIGAALETIRGDYALYRANAFKCYEEVYEFGRHFEAVVEEIQKIGNEKGADHE
jgi:glycosyltransferase involved in cell wall biosynthesis